MTHELALDPPELMPALAQQVSGIAPPSRPGLRIASDGPAADLDAAERAAADFLAALGIELNREGLRETPARMARAYAELFDARPLQLTTLDAHLHPRGAGVLLEAEHTCMTLRGVRALGAKTVTSALAGMLRTDARSRAEFFALAHLPG